MLQFGFVQVDRNGEWVHRKSCVAILKGRMKVWGNNNFKMCLRELLRIGWHFLNVRGISNFGAWGRTRTDTLFPAADFESAASTDFATQALRGRAE